MSLMHSRIQSALATIVGGLALLSAMLLLTCDVSPSLFPSNVHDILAALPLVLVAFGYLLFRAATRAQPVVWAKALILALAFLFWAANQICVVRATATLFNDIAVGLFVLDVFLVIIGWPSDAIREPTRESL
jgi:hypothetical protein